MSCANKKCTNPTNKDSEYCPICRLMLQVKEYDLYMCENCESTWCEPKVKGESAKTYQLDKCKYCSTIFGRIKKWLLKRIYPKKKMM